MYFDDDGYDESILIMWCNGGDWNSDHNNDSNSNNNNNRTSTWASQPASQPAGLSSFRSKSRFVVLVARVGPPVSGQEGEELKEEEKK